MVKSGKYVPMPGLHCICLQSVLTKSPTPLASCNACRLMNKQQSELQQKMNEHQQKNLPNNGVQEWNVIAAQLQNRHTYQRQQFEGKKTEMKKRSDQELQAQDKILEAHHKKRQAEAGTFIKDLVSKCRKQQENLKARLLRLHEERFANKTKEVQAACTLTVDDDCPSHPATTLALQQSKSTALTEDGQHHNDSELHVHHKATKGGNGHEGSVSHDAVVRQKRRKTLMNIATIQLAIEIHNEGIIAMTKSSNHSESGGDKRSTLENNDDKFSSDKTSGRSSLFIPWGGKSRDFLYSIVMGEIPPGQLSRFVGRGGGLIKCMITDTRTGESSARADRSSTMATIKEEKSKLILEEIQRKQNNVCSAISSLQADCTLLKEKEEKFAAAYTEAALQFEKATQTLNKFKAQAQHFFNGDGTPSPRVNPGKLGQWMTINL